MIRLILIFLLLCVSSACAAADRLYVDSELRFSIDYGNNWSIVPNELKPQGVVVMFFSSKDDSLIKVDAVVSEVPYSFRWVLKNTSLFAPKRAELISKSYKPFYHTLRNTITLIYRYDNGLFEQQRLIVRNKTLFILTAINTVDDFADADAVMSTFDVQPTIWHNFRAYRANIGWLIASILLSLPCFLGRMTAKYRDLFKTFGINRGQYSLYIVLSVSTSLFVLLSSLDDVRLGLSLMMVYWILWYVFFMKNSALIRFINGLLSP